MNLRYSLWIVLILLAAGALQLHLRIHPLFLSVVNHKFDNSSLAAISFTLFDLIIVSFLFLSAKTSAYAYLLNGILAIFAFILMGHLSVHNLLLKQLQFNTWIFTSTLPHILFSFADFFVGYTLFYIFQLGDPIEQ